MGAGRGGGPALSRARETLLLAAVLLAFSVLGVLLGRSADGNTGLHPWSTHEAGISGTKAFFLYLEKKGYPVTRWYRPLTELPATAGVVAVIQPVEPVDWESNEILNWVEQGGTLIVAGVVEPLNPPLRGGGRPGSLAPVQPSRYTAGVDRVRIESRQRFDPDVPEGVPYVADEAGAVLVAYSLGEGRVIALADPWPLTNDGIRREDNLVLAENLVRAAGPGRTILFDEYHHGFHAGARSLWRALPVPARMAAGQLALVVAAYLLLRARRFGPARPLPPGPPRAAAEFVGAVADLYRRARARAQLLGYLARPLVHDLRRLTGAGAGVPDEELARLAARRLGLDGDDLARLLARCRAAGEAGRLAEPELLDLARRIDAYRTGRDKTRPGR